MEDYAFNMSQLALPDCLVDRANRQQPTASDQVKDTMVQLFAGDDYASHMHMLRVANPKAAQALVPFAQDVSAAHGPETLEQGLPAGLTQTEEKRVDTHELVLALLWRTHARRHSCGALHMRGPTLARACTPLLATLGPTPRLGAAPASAPDPLPPPRECLAAPGPRRCAPLLCVYLAPAESPRRARLRLWAVRSCTVAPSRIVESCVETEVWVLARATTF